MEKELEKPKEKIAEPLPYCITAPSPEQARASNEDEPCDDARAGDVGSGSSEEDPAE